LLWLIVWVVVFRVIPNSSPALMIFWASRATYAALP